MDKIRDAYLALSDREKRMVLILGCILAIVIVGGGGYWLIRSAVKRSTAIVQTRQRISDIYQLEQPYSDAKARMDDLHQRVNANRTSLFTLVEDVSSQVGIQIEDVKEKTEHVDNTQLDEVSVIVHLKQLSVDRLTAFLEGVEETAQNDLVKVTRLEIKTRYDRPELLDAQMTIATWKNS